VTITAWRIVQERHLATAFSGEGAARHPGRWNERGVPMVYTAATLSLAALEILVHVGSDAVLFAYQCIPVHFDAGLCTQVLASDLPDDWAADPAADSTKAMGTEWVKEASSPILVVPSAVVPLESVYLINPRHVDFPRIVIGRESGFRFDARLLPKTV
jgi:RES domain-containing protein